MMARIPTIRAIGRPDSAGVPVPVSLLLLELAAVVEANGLSTSRISSVGGLPFSSRFEDEVVLGVGVGVGAGVAAVLLVALSLEVEVEVVPDGLGDGDGLGLGLGLGDGLALELLVDELDCCELLEDCCWLPTG